MSTLDDLVALLLQGQHPFDDEAFRQAGSLYRLDSPVKGAVVRQQVNLAACLYLEVKGERPTEPRVKSLGGWGSRNDILADIGAFHSGRRPVSSSTLSNALPALPASSGMKAGDALQIVMQQGLEAAQRMITESVRAEFEERLQHAQEDFSRRLKNFEEMALEAGRRQESAESQRLILERKLDETLERSTAVVAELAVAKAEGESAKIQTVALIETVQRERAALDAANVEIRHLGEKLTRAMESAEQERRQQLLGLDAVRQKDVQIEKIRSSLEKATDRAAQLEVELTKVRGQLHDAQSRVLTNEQLASAYQTILDVASATLINATTSAIDRSAGETKLAVLQSLDAVSTKYEHEFGAMREDVQLVVSNVQALERKIDSHGDELKKEGEHRRSKGEKR